MRRKLIAGNWKMNGTYQQNAVLLERIKAGVSELTCDVVVCPPYPYLGQAQSILDGSSVNLGAQSLSEYPVGAYTGEVSAYMLLDFGCRYVLVGHSERRTCFGETDEVVAAKFGAALAAGLTPVLCVGETFAERQAGETCVVVARQLSGVLSQYGVSAMAKAVIAYEPVWAIGTGLTASPGQVQEVHVAIRAQVSGLDMAIGNELRIVYGGSVKPQNAQELFGQSDIDGGLIGGAALVADDFLEICLAAN
ncbi:MAG: triose-phosphate isomerase [Betaproteobacteria bacterium]|nr:triose-phosphate isomerase [Betaproteobacteria bacterium]